MTKTTEMDEFERLLEESFKSKLSVADVVRGAIIKKENEGYLVDIGSKCEAFLPNREVPSSLSEELKVGDCKEFYILKEEEDGKSIMLLSLKRVACAQAWQSLQNSKITGGTVTAKVVSLVKGGVIVEVEDLRGFIPASQLRTGMPFDGLMNQEIEVKVLEADAKRNKLILSQRQALAEQREQLVDEVISNLTVDQTVSGEVVRIADFGAFIDINGVDGLLPISEISWQRIKHPSDILTLGQKLEVKVLKIDEELKRISLSLKRIGDNPWEEIEDKFQEGEIITGIVNKVTSFGAFINIFPGVEALLPVAEMEDNNANPFDVYKNGDEVKVLIKKFTPQEHRIALSIRDMN